MGRKLRSEKIKIKCLFCGKEKEVYNNPNQSFKFCSKKCYFDFKHNNQTITKICEVCGKEFTIDKSIDYRYKNCGMECRIIDYDRRNIKSRGGSWKIKKEKALIRDNYLCKMCGNVAEDVHHIIPHKDFTSNKDAHKLTNLISLCKKCHKLTYNNEYEFVGLFKRILGLEEI